MYCNVSRLYYACVLSVIWTPEARCMIYCVYLDCY